MMTSELIRLFVHEAIHRSRVHKEASRGLTQEEDIGEDLTYEDLLSILPQLFMDFT